MNYVFWLVVPIESLPTMTMLMSDEGDHPVAIPGLGFEVGVRKDGVIKSGAGEEYDHTGRFIDAENQQAEWTKSLEFNNAYLNLSTYIQRVPHHIAQHLAIPFNQNFNERGFGIVTVNGRWKLVEIHSTLDTELAKETYHFHHHGVAPGEQQQPE